MIYLTDAELILESRYSSILLTVLGYQKVFMVPLQRGIGRERPSKNRNIQMTFTSKGISFPLSSKNTPSSTPYGVGNKIKAVPEAKPNDELPAGMGDDYTYYPLVIYDNFKDG